MLGGFAVNVTVWLADIGVTVTDARLDVPPGPVHWNWKVVAAVIGFERPDPDNVPLLLHGPYAVQVAAFVELQLRVTRAPLVTVAELLPFTSNEAVGCTCGVTDNEFEHVLLPPAPETVIVQFSVPTLANDSGIAPLLGLTEEETGVGPEHESVALVASVLLQESVLL